jgi:AcrR family transcriptional regulator
MERPVMAQILKEVIKNKIHEMAVEEFFNHDYRSATLRSIAGKAGIPVGLIYSYYKNKADLFDAVVRPVYLTIKQVLLTPVTFNTIDQSIVDFHLQTEIAALLEILENSRKVFIILLEKSKGTQYESAREDFIQFTMTHIQNRLRGKLKNENEIDNLLYHILANNFMETLLEIARHYKSREWASRMMNILTQQYFLGLASLLK